MKMEAVSAYLLIRIEWEWDSLGLSENGRKWDWDWDCTSIESHDSKLHKNLN